MEFLIVLCGIIILILSLYLFMLKKEIKKTKTQLKIAQEENSNVLLSRGFDDKSLNELIAEINKMLKYIHEKERKIYARNEALQKMITNIAHDLRTPLTSALGYIDMVKHETLTEGEKEKYLSIIEERLNKLSYLITSFFEFSKVVSQNQEIELNQENVIEILENSIVHFYEDFSNAGRQIDLETSVNRLEMMTNKSLLTRVFDNLIVNAYKHSDGDLTIRVNKQEENILLEFENEIEDNMLDVDAIFDEFYTADISRTKGNTGLGLAIAKEFVELLHGKICAQKANGMLKIKITL